MHYINEIGAPAHADSLDSLTSAAAACGLELENWYGVLAHQILRRTPTAAAS